MVDFSFNIGKSPRPLEINGSPPQMPPQFQGGVPPMPHNFMQEGLQQFGQQRVAYNMMPTTQNVYTSGTPMQDPNTVAIMAYEAENGQGSAQKAGMDSVRNWASEKFGGDPGQGGEIPE